MRNVLLGWLCFCSATAKFNGEPPLLLGDTAISSHAARAQEPRLSLAGSMNTAHVSVNRPFAVELSSPPLACVI